MKYRVWVIAALVLLFLALALGVWAWLRPAPPKPWIDLPDGLPLPSAPKIDGRPLWGEKPVGLVRGCECGDGCRCVGPCLCGAVACAGQPPAEATPPRRPGPEGPFSPDWTELKKLLDGFFGQARQEVKEAYRSVHVEFLQPAARQAETAVSVGVGCAIINTLSGIVVACAAVVIAVKVGGNAA